MSPRYKHGDETFRRKNFYMPCIINDRFDSLPPEEQVRLLKATYWADNMTESEWPVVLRKPDCSPSARSRLKRKATGWLVALQRIARLHPEFFEAIAAQADTLYREQIEEPPPIHLVWDGSMFVSGAPTKVGARIDWHPEADS